MEKSLNLNSQGGHNNRGGGGKIDIGKILMYTETNKTWWGHHLRLRTSYIYRGHFPIYFTSHICNLVTHAITRSIAFELCLGRTISFMLKLNKQGGCNKNVMVCIFWKKIVGGGTSILDWRVAKTKISHLNKPAWGDMNIFLI